MKSIIVLSLVGFSLQKPTGQTTDILDIGDTMEMTGLIAVNENVPEAILSSELKIVSLLDQIILESLRVQRMSVISERKGRKRRLRRRKLVAAQQDGDMIPLVRSVFSTLIGRAPTRLGSHWSRALECCYASNHM